MPALPRLAVACCLAPLLAACGGDDARALQQARDALAADLPSPYFEDLVVESVTVEGDALVQLVRSPAGRAGPTRASPRFDELRQSEQDALVELCAEPAIAALSATDARLVRRFVDREDGVFFEVEMPARDCAGAGG